MNTGLRRGIGAHPESGLVRSTGADVDDRRRVGKVPQCGATGVECRTNVDAVHPIPGVYAAIGNRLPGEAAGDVDEPVDRPRPRYGFRNGVLNLCRLAEVDTAQSDRNAVDSLDRVVQVDTGDRVAHLAEYRDDFAAKCAGRPCDYDVHRPSCSCRGARR